MNRKPNIEEALKRAGIKPAQRVKSAVLGRYAEQHGHERQTSAGAMEFWRRPVPFYAAAVLALVIAWLSFIGGQKLSRPDRNATRSAAFVQDSLANAALERSWHSAPRDVL